MVYRKRRKSRSGFDSYCKAELSRVKKATTPGSRSKSAHKYQKCLALRHNIKSGYKLSKKEKEEKGKKGKK